MTATPRRRWYQFSLKTLLVVMVLLCLGPGGYVAYEQNKVRREKEAVEAIEKLGGVVSYGRSASARSAMLQQVLGDDTIGTVESVDFWNPSQVTDDDVAHLAQLPRLKHLNLTDTQVTDAGLKHLAGLKDLSGLTLDNTQVTDAGLVHLAGLKGLRHLNVYRTLVTDAGALELQESLPNCRIGR
jgi:predicted negative regulator of RcsB-dependent stress response